MPDFDKLLELSKHVAVKAGEKLLKANDSDYKKHKYIVSLPKEIKSGADSILEKYILHKLVQAGFPVLSEEAGLVNGEIKSKYMFIVDPLDGTYNFVKNLGAYAVSIAFWKGKKPIFGVIYDLTDRNLYWGGDYVGAYCNDQPISVSDTKYHSEAAICTGFPVRFDVDSDNERKFFWNLVGSFSKIRMLGSAAISLINVAKGSADVYSEQNIMLWDVAAGLAIVEGAGGQININMTDYMLNAYASNKHLTELI